MRYNFLNFTSTNIDLPPKLLNASQRAIRAFTRQSPYVRILKVSGISKAHSFSYLHSPTFSDGVVRCEDKELPIHKVVLCTQSSYFLKAFSRDWKACAEAIENCQETGLEVM